MKVARFSALRTGHLYLQEGFVVLISIKRLSRPQGHNATGRIKSIKNSSDFIGNGTRDLPACSAVPQPTVKITEQATSLTNNPTKRGHNSKTGTSRFGQGIVFLVCNSERHYLEINSLPLGHSLSQFFPIHHISQSVPYSVVKSFHYSI
jgi:hypothetical protein